MTEECYLERRRPAHHAPVERFNEPVIVQVSVCTKARRPVLACEAAHLLCREVWQASDFWRVGQYVIMPDHIHLFCAPGRSPMPSLKQWVEYWKGQIAARWPVAGSSGGPTSVSAVRTDGTADGTEVGPPGFKLWQRDFWDTQMRSREHYNEKLSYVRMNPVRKGLVNEPKAWPYQGQVFPIAWS